jgi:hypothetical protein
VGRFVRGRQEAELDMRQDIAELQSTTRASDEIPDARLVSIQARAPSGRQASHLLARLQPEGVLAALPLGLVGTQLLGLRRTTHEPCVSLHT